MLSDGWGLRRNLDYGTALARGEVEPEEVRAVGLLRRFCDRRRFRLYCATGVLFAMGNVSRRIYQIRRRERVMELEDGVPVVNHCVHVGQELLPWTDRVLAIKNLVEGEERAFLRTAISNPIMLTPGLRPNDRMDDEPLPPGVRAGFDATLWFLPEWTTAARAAWPRPMEGEWDLMDYEEAGALARFAITMQKERTADARRRAMGQPANGIPQCNDRDAGIPVRNWRWAIRDRGGVPAMFLEQADADPAHAVAEGQLERRAAALRRAAEGSPAAVLARNAARDRGAAAARADEALKSKIADAVRRQIALNPDRPADGRIRMDAGAMARLGMDPAAEACDLALAARAEGIRNPRFEIAG